MTNNRRFYIAFLVLISCMIVLQALAMGFLLMPHCAQEDSMNCRWDASQDGNGIGRSFIDIAGTAYYLP